MSENSGRVKNRLVDLACFTALVVAAVLLLIENLLPLCKVYLHGSWTVVLRTIQNIAVLIAVASGAYKFSKNTRNIVFRILYFLAIVVYIIAIILAFFQ